MATVVVSLHEAASISGIYVECVEVRADALYWGKVLKESVSCADIEWERVA